MKQQTNKSYKRSFNIHNIDIRNILFPYFFQLEWKVSKIHKLHFLYKNKTIFLSNFPTKMFLIKFWIISILLIQFLGLYLSCFDSNCGVWPGEGGGVLFLLKFAIYRAEFGR